MTIYFRGALALISLVLVLLDLYLFIKGAKTPIVITKLNVFIFEKLFVIGRTFLKKLKVRSSYKNRRKKMLLELFERGTAESISENATYAIYTYTLIFTPVLLVVFILTENIKILCLMTLLVGFMCAYFDLWLTSVIRKRHAEILSQYATVLTKMSLLVNAGITASEAFERVALSNDGILYKEMQRTVSDIKNGISYSLALDNLAIRGGCKEVKKFVSLYKQNLVKGGPEFPYLLSEMADNVWAERKTRAKLAGSAASQKLLLPILLMFIGILLMVIVPAFNSLL